MSTCSFPRSHHAIADHLRSNLKTRFKQILVEDPHLSCFNIEDSTLAAVELESAMAETKGV
jgi:hypothetical protein